VNTYVILAAGAGKRLWPLTESYPKPLARVLGKSLLEWLIEGLLPTARKVVVVAGAGKAQVEQHLSTKPYAGKLAFAEQREPLGSGHALLQAEPHVDKDFVLLNGDNFYDPAAFPLVAEAVREGPFTFAKPVEDRRPYGVFKVERGLLRGVIEKPPEPGPGLANLNLFHAPVEFFSLLARLKPSPRGELEVTDALRAFAERNDVRVHELRSYWTDVGYFWNYLDANAYAAGHLAEAKVLGEVEDGARLTGPVFVGEGSVVKSGTRIEGPVWIGPGCRVGPNAYLRPGTVLEGDNHVGVSEVKASVLLRGANAPHFNYVGDSVLGERVNLGAGTNVANLRFDGQNVQVQVNGKVIDSGRPKLGVCLGAGAKTGIHCSLLPGVLVGAGARVWPGVTVRRNVPAGGLLSRGE
jgi:bifunctional UDP-N-acetylglucosamine pyrophosphorylase/glucosamine-1-phosphate N-acetyltransferase